MPQLSGIDIQTKAQGPVPQHRTLQADTLKDMPASFRVETPSTSDAMALECAQRGSINT